MRRIILSLFATGLLAACPGDSGVPPPSPTTPLAGEATPTGGGGSGLSTLSLGDPKILTVVKEQFIQTFGDDSCSVPAGAVEVSDQWLRVGSGLQCRQIAWTIGNSGGSCEAGCKDWPDPTTEGEGEGATTEETPTTEVPPPPVEDAARGGPARGGHARGGHAHGGHAHGGHAHGGPAASGLMHGFLRDIYPIYERGNTSGDLRLFNPLQVGCWEMCNLPIEVD